MRLVSASPWKIWLLMVFLLISFQAFLPGNVNAQTSVRGFSLKSGSIPQTNGDSSCSTSPNPRTFNCTIVPGDTVNTPLFYCDGCAAGDTISVSAPTGLPSATSYSIATNPFVNANGTYLTIYTNIGGATPPGAYSVSVGGYDQTNGQAINPLIVNVIIKAPRITGAKTLWWFVNEFPPGYATSTSLSTTSGYGSYTWKIVAGGGTKAIFAGNLTTITTSSSTIPIYSKGRSTVLNDVLVTVTVNGATSSSFPITVRSPYKLTAQAPIDELSPITVWESLLTYSISDQFNIPMPSSVPVGETFTSGVKKDYPGTNWGLPEQIGGPTDAGQPSVFVDVIAPPFVSNTNVPQPVYGAGTATKVDHWTGYLSVGSSLPARGFDVQLNTWQTYIGAGRHIMIVSPVPGN
jgi:hypothetical protein